LNAGAADRACDQDRRTALSIQAEPEALVLGEFFKICGRQTGLGSFVNSAKRHERDAQTLMQDGRDNRRRQVTVLERVGRDVCVQGDEAQRLPKVSAPSGVGAAEELVQLLIGVEHVTHKIIHRSHRTYTLAARQLVKRYPTGRPGRDVTRVVAACAHRHLLHRQVSHEVSTTGQLRPVSRWHRWLHSWWRSRLIGDGHLSSNEPLTRAKILGDHSLNGRSQTSKARGGLRPPWVQIPPLPL
jgi:hypothetical protein